MPGLSQFDPGMPDPFANVPVGQTVFGVSARLTTTNGARALSWAADSSALSYCVYWFAGAGPPVLGDTARVVAVLPSGVFAWTDYDPARLSLVGRYHITAAH